VKFAAALGRVLQRRCAPTAITVDNGGEFVSRAMDAWAYAHDVRLDFIRPGKPVENAFIEGFNGKLRDECLNSHVFASAIGSQQILDTWREDYNLVRPHSSLRDRTPAAVSLPSAVCFRGQRQDRFVFTYPVSWFSGFGSQTPTPCHVLECRRLAPSVDVDHSPIVVHSPIIRPDGARLQAQPLADALLEVFVVHALRWPRVGVWKSSRGDRAGIEFSIHDGSTYRIVRRRASDRSCRCARQATTTDSSGSTRYQIPNGN
jgi:Integrase core domain